jgi:hypothetical protein
VLLAVLTVGVYAIREGTLPEVGVLVATVYWGGLNIVLLAGFVSRGWHGLTAQRHASEVAAVELIEVIAR